MEFDYVVVGAGAAGSVLANRLSEDPGNRVLLLEYGGGDANPLLRVPAGSFLVQQGERYAYHYATQPIGPGGQVESWTRGKVLGGSAAINGMMWTRGAAADFDGLEARGNPGWGWDRVLPAYRAMEDHSLGGSELRGAGGPLGVSVADVPDEISEAVLASAQVHGWERVADLNAHDSERIGLTPTTTRHGRRTSAYGAFVRPVRSRPNLTVATRTRVGHLLFDGLRVVGVRARTGTRTVDHRARREVVLAAGAIETPLLLERSGIGRPDVLTAAGIDVRVESPNVGERLLEHRGVIMQVRLRPDSLAPPLMSTRGGQGRALLRYLRDRGGPLASGGFDVSAQLRSAPGLARPDVHGIFVPMALDTSGPTPKPARYPGLVFMGYPIRPTTASSVHVSGPLPEDAPVIHARFLDDDADRAATVPILDAVRTLLSRGPVADLVLDEELPGPAVSTPEQVLRHALDAGSGIYHGVGSAAMGPEDDDVVDPALRVRGVTGLRVADASVLPVQVSGNTAAPTMAVGWLAADHVLADA